jgi:hypothetical protein
MDWLTDWMFSLWHPRDTPNSWWRRKMVETGYRLHVWYHERKQINAQIHHF